MPWRSSGASGFGLAAAAAAPCGSRARRQDARAGAQAEVERVVGRGVAGVQRDHHVDRVGHEAAQVALHEAQPSQRARAAAALHSATRSARSSTPVTSGAPPKRRRRYSWTAKVR
jgi:hypothetical protein